MQKNFVHGNHIYLFTDGHNLHKYNTRLADDINEDIPAKTPVSNLSSNSPPSPPSPPRKPSKSNHSSLFSYLMKPFVLVVIVAVIGASPFLYSYLDLGGKGPEDTSIKPPMVEENLNNADVPSQHIDSDTPPNNDPLPPSSSSKLILNFISFTCNALFEESLKSRDLFRIIKLLNDNDYDVGTWSDLCLALGLSQSRINTIKKDEMDSSDRLRSCLSKWLNRVDQVDQFGGATLASLLTALENIGQKPVAEGKYHVTRSTLYYFLFLIRSERKNKLVNFL